jgi:hypothetical protein
MVPVAYNVVRLGARFIEEKMAVRYVIAVFLSEFFDRLRRRCSFQLVT